MKRPVLMSLAGRRAGRFAAIPPAFFVLVSFGVTPGPAQVKTAKRDISVRGANAAEGAKVTVVSNEALNDYEAYWKGDRFYLKVPRAGLAGEQPKLRGQGFDDVEVLKTGDDIVFSFRLQPGTAARVNQSRSRLDVVFSPSAPLRNTATERPPTEAASNGPADSGSAQAPLVMQTSRDSRLASEVREKARPIKSNPNAGATNSTLAPEVVVR